MGEKFDHLPDTKRLQYAMQLTIEFLDLQMQARPSEELAKASNTVQDELNKLIRATGEKTE